MFKTKKSQSGFTLIEVVAAAALLGLLVTMAMPALSGANARVKNAKLKADLATADQAIALYLVDKGSVPASLSDLYPDYLNGSEVIKDAKNEPLSYSGSGSTYTLSGNNSENVSITSNGSNGVKPEETPQGEGGSQQN